MGFVRFFLAASVVIGHAPAHFGFKLLPDTMAVEVFFIISGFYMSMILTEKYTAQNWRGRVDFYCSRFFRLWPVFIITTVLTLLFDALVTLYLGHEPMASGDIRGAINNDFLYGLFQLSNLTMIGQDVPYWFHASPATGMHFTLGPPETLADGSLFSGSVLLIGPAWSIGAEIWFYLLAPFLIVLHSRWIVLIAIASAALKIWLSTHGLIAYFFFPAQVGMFAIGMLAQRAGINLLPRTPALAMLGVGSVLIGAVAYSVIDNPSASYAWIMYLVFAAALPSLFTLTKSWEFDRKLGELSYPIYLTHMLVMYAVSLIGKRVGLFEYGEVVLVASTALGCILFTWVETPVNRWRARFAKRQPS
jgi:peptidoglycan/LPS O-acetylase OafA/YrhL